MLTSTLYKPDTSLRWTVELGLDGVHLMEGSLYNNFTLCVGAREGITDLTQKIEVLGQGQAVDWKQAYREVRTYYKELAMVRLQEQQEKGQSQTKFRNGKVAYL